MTNICSVWAYNDIVASGFTGKRQGQHLYIFARERRPLTHREVTELVKDEFRIWIDQRGSRVSELEQCGLIRKVDKIKCPVTNMTVNRWQWTGRRVPLESKEAEVKCDKCHGTGKIEVIAYYDPEYPSKIVFTRQRKVKKSKIEPQKEHTLKIVSKKQKKTKKVRNDSQKKLTVF